MTRLLALFIIVPVLTVGLALFGIAAGEPGLFPLALFPLAIAWPLDIAASL